MVMEGRSEDKAATHMDTNIPHRALHHVHTSVNRPLNSMRRRDNHGQSICVHR